MNLKHRKIERILRRTSFPSVPQDLYDRLKADLPDLHAVPESVGRLAWLAGHRLAVALALLLASTALGSGAYLVHHLRTRNYTDVPKSRLRGVKEAPIVYPEDVQPLSAAFLQELSELTAKAAEHQKETGKRTRWALVDFQPDGTGFFWYAERAEDDFLRKTGYVFHSDTHPNDFRSCWRYELDGSPLRIEEVDPHSKRQWKTGDLTDGGLPVSDGYEKGAGYLIRAEAPKGEWVINKWLLLDQNWARPNGETWDAAQNNIQFGGRHGDDWAQAVLFVVKLPPGAQLAKSTPAPSQETVDAENRATLLFPMDTRGQGHVPPVEISYRLAPAPKS